MKRLVSVLSVLMLAGGLFSLDGREIAQKSHDVAESKTTRSAVMMELINSNGDVDTRMVEEFGIKEDGLSSTIMIFRAPASVKNTRFLKMENDGRADDKWIYLPALKRVRRIASSDGSKSFMGTDFTYDDMETREVERDNHTLLREENFNGFDCYVLRAESVDPEDSQYSYRVTWIRKDNFVPIKMELFDKNEKLEKVMTVLDLQQIDGYWTPVKAEMKNVQEDHKTVITIKKIVFDKGVDKKMFTTNFLKTGRSK